jgi:hypothetical protein
VYECRNDGNPALSRDDDGSIDDDGSMDDRRDGIDRPRGRRRHGTVEARCHDARAPVTALLNAERDPI